jgi:hypothetical protein
MNQHIAISARRALHRPCQFDLLALHRRNPTSAWMTCRSAVVRLNALASELGGVDPVNATTLAKKFGTTTKTIYRDIACLRKHFGARIVYNPYTFTFSMPVAPSGLLATQ